MRELLNGLVDMHIHGSPAVAPRMETWEFLREMDEAGYRGIGLKEHFIPTTGLASLINRSPCGIHTEVAGSLVLNNACGGLNLTVVDAAWAMGAKVIYLPTVSAKNHCDYLKTVSNFGGGSLTIPEKPIRILKEDGSLTDAVYPIVDYLKDRPELVLSMGHLSAEEIDVFLPFALSQGIKKWL